MQDFFDDTYTEGENDWDEGNQAPTDPFEGLSRKEQDLFFRILDLLPREQLEYAMDYFMSHPAKIRAVVNYAMQKKELIANKDVEKLNQLFEQEQIIIQKGEEIAAQDY